MNKPKFTKEQEYWLCYEIGEWYLDWKNECKDDCCCYLGFARENLKQRICREKDKEASDI